MHREESDAPDAEAAAVRLLVVSALVDGAGVVSYPTPTGVVIVVTDDELAGRFMSMLEAAAMADAHVGEA